MGYSVFPAPSSGISTTDLITSPKWNTIATSSASNVTQVTFSNISGYSRLRLLLPNMFSTGQAYPQIYINTVHTDKYTSWTSDEGSAGSATSNLALGNINSSSFILTARTTQNQGYQMSGWIDFFDADSSIPQKTAQWTWGYYASNGYWYRATGMGIWRDSQTISQIQFSFGGGAFYTQQANNIVLLGAK